MRKAQVDRRDTGRRKSQRILRNDTGRKVDLVHAEPRPTRQAAKSAWLALRASSRSTVFIMEDGPVSAFFFCTVR